MCINVCVYVCVYVWAHVCVYVCVHVCVYVCVHVCVYVCVHVCVNVRGWASDNLHLTDIYMYLLQVLLFNIYSHLSPILTLTYPHTLELYPTCIYVRGPPLPRSEALKLLAPLRCGSVSNTLVVV